MVETESNQPDEIEDAGEDETDIGSNWDNTGFLFKGENDSKNDPGELVKVDEDPDPEDPGRSGDSTTDEIGGVVDGGAVEEKVKKGTLEHGSGIEEKVYNEDRQRDEGTNFIDS